MSSMQFRSTAPQHLVLESQPIGDGIPTIVTLENKWQLIMEQLALYKISNTFRERHVRVELENRDESV